MKKLCMFMFFIFIIGCQVQSSKEISNEDVGTFISLNIEGNSWSGVFTHLKTTKGEFIVQGIVSSCITGKHCQIIIKEHTVHDICDITKPRHYQHKYFVIDNMFYEIIKPYET